MHKTSNKNQAGKAINYGVVVFRNTPSLAFKGHGIQGSLVKILPKIRVTFSSQLVKVKGLRVNP